MMNGTEILSEAVKLKRHKLGLSARALSESCGLSSSYVSKVENKEVSPSLAVFSKLATVLKFSDQEIVFIVRCQKNE
jgi:transcriptional regulator with XRE-family HTH domain